MFVYRKDTKEIVMICEQEPQMSSDNLRVSKKMLSDEEIEKKNKGFKLYYNNSKIEIKDSERIKKTRLKERVENAKSIDELKQILIDIIN